MKKATKKQMLLPITGCLIVQLCVGIIYLWSIFKTPIVQSFGWNDAAAKMVSSYMLAAFVAGSLLGGLLNDAKGPRFTCFAGIILFSAGVGSTALLSGGTIGLISLTYAVVGGVGSGIAYSACISCVQKWLPDKKGLASGLAVSAFGFSTVIFASVAKLLMSAFTNGAGVVDFAPVFFILAGIFLLLGMLGCLLIKLPDNTQPADARPHKDDMTLGQAVRTVPFWCIFLIIFFINGTWNLTVPLIYDLGISRGLSVAAATFAVSFTGLPNAAGRLVMATVSDKLGRSRTLDLLAVVTLACAILMISVGGKAYIAVVAIIAFAYGGPASVNAAFCTDYFGTKHSGSNYGAAMLALGASSLFFNAVSSLVLDGNVTATFIMAAASAVISLLLTAFMRRYDSLHGSVSAVSAVAMAHKS